MHSPIGDLTVFEEDEQVVSLDWGWVPEQWPSPLLAQAKEQLERYFDGELTDFDLPLAPDGTPFQKRVWAAMLGIPFGETRSYGDVAADISSAPQPVGQACGANPIPIIIPCHRITASSGHLGGYSGKGGIDTKIALLRLEGARL